VLATLAARTNEYANIFHGPIHQKGLKAAFKSHMGLFTRLIPSSQTASCNAIYNSPNQDSVPVESSSHPNGNHLKPIHRGSLTKSGTHLDHLTKDPNFLPI